MEMEQVKKSADIGSATGADAPGVGEASTILFPQGLPGFPAATRFALRPLANGPQSLLLLQSVDDPDLRFLVLPYMGDELPLRRCDLEAACAALGIAAEHAAVLLVVTRQPVEAGHGAPLRLFVNLRAPVVLDTLRRTAVQHVLPSPGYAFRFPLPAAA